MATLKHRNTGHTVTTTHAPEIVSLRAQGYADVPEPKEVDKTTETDAGKTAGKPIK